MKIPSISIIIQVVLQVSQPEQPPSLQQYTQRTSFSAQISPLLSFHYFAEYPQSVFWLTLQKPSKLQHYCLHVIGSHVFNITFLKFMKSMSMEKSFNLFVIIFILVLVS